MLVFVTDEAKKQYQRLPISEQKKIKKKLTALEEDHLIGKKLEGKLGNLRSIKVWPYRIIYTIEMKKMVVVKAIIHRQGAYK